MPTIAELAFKANTKEVDDGIKKFDDLRKAASKFDKTSIKPKIDTTSIGSAERKINDLVQQMRVAESKASSFGRSLDPLKGLTGPLGEIAGKVEQLAGTLGGNIGSGFVRAITNAAGALKDLRTQSSTTSTTLQQGVQVLDSSDASLLELAGAYVAAQKGASLLEMAIARNNLVQATSVRATGDASTAVRDWAKALEVVKKETINIQSLMARQNLGPQPEGFERERKISGIQFGAARKREAETAPAARAAIAIAEKMQFETHISASQASLAAFSRFAVPAFSGIAVAAAGASVAFLANAAAARSAADDAQEMADKMGITTTRLAALRVIADENSGSVEGLQKVFDKLSKSMNKMDEDNEKTKYSFESLGLKMKDLAGLSESEIAIKVVQNFKLLGENAKTVAAITTLIGPAFREQIPSILKLGEGIEEVEKRILSYGAVASAELVKAGADQETAMTNLGLAWKGLSNEMATWAGNMTTNIIKWASETINSIRGVMGEMRKVREEAGGIERIPQARRNQLLKESRDEVRSSGVLAGEGSEADVNRVFKERLKREVALREQGEEEFNREKNRGTASTVLALKAASAAAKDPAKVKEEADAASKAAKEAADARKKAADAHEQALARLQEMERKAAQEQLDYEVAEDRARTQANEKQIEDDKRIAEGLKQKADAIRSQIDPNFVVMQQLKEINELETAGALSSKEATKAREEANKYLIDTQDTFAAGWSNAFKQFQNQAITTADAGRMAFETMSDAMTAGVTEFVLTGKLNFKDFARSVVASLAEIYAKMLATKLVTMAINAFSGAGGGVGDAGYGDYKGYFDSLEARVGGGSVLPGQEYAVGENGPEVLRMGSMGGFVTPSKAANDPGGMQIGSINIHVEGGETNEETAAVLRKELLNTMQEVADGRISEATRPGGLLRRA